MIIFKERFLLKRLGGKRFFYITNRAIIQDIM